MDIDNLEVGEELDTLIAEKVMGWRLSASSAERGRAWLNADGKETGFQVGDRPPFDWDMEYFQPSVGISPAWAVVEALRRRFGVVEVHGHDDPKSPGTTDEHSDLTFWECDIGAGGEIFASAGTAPLAICRAALKAVL